MRMNGRLDEFFVLPPAERAARLHRAILTSHHYHFRNNAAYRRTVSARGVGATVGPRQFARLLRPASLTFKSYVDRTGPFPEDDPPAFLAWLGEQVSGELLGARAGDLRRNYATLEALIAAVEGLYADLGLEVVTSTGTSGVASMVVRNRDTVTLAVDAFFTGIRRAWGIDRGTALVFMMPEDSRVAMARIARIGTRVLGWAGDGQVWFTMPFSATPDRLRIRAGRTFRPGVRGLVERGVLHPFMGWAHGRLATPRYVALTMRRVNACIAAGTPLMVLGGLAQLHALSPHAPIRLPPGSRVATGGGMKERHGVSPASIYRDLRATFPETPVCDVYGMAEANWAAFECPEGHHHLPPWVHAVVTNDDDLIVDGPDVGGQLAFFDPVGGGDVIPPFFQTADRVRLVNGGGTWDERRRCACGQDTAYIAGGIERIDLMEEAGCAAQV